MSIDSFFYVPAGTRDLEPGKQDYKKYKTVSDFVAAHGDRPFPHQVATGARRQEDLEHASQQGKDDNRGKKATHSLARLLVEYATTRSFARVSGRHGHPPAGNRARLPARGREGGGRRKGAAGTCRVDTRADRQGQSFRRGREQASGGQARRRLREGQRADR